MASHHKSRAKGTISTILIAAPLCILLISSASIALVDFSHLAASPAPAGAQAPGQVDLGVFRPTGRVNPDGSEVWVPRDDSILAGRIEVDVREDGRVIRQKVLRPLRASDIVLAFSLSPNEEERVSPRSSSPAECEAACAAEPEFADLRRAEWR